MMREIDLAYIAAFTDGEGCIAIQRKLIWEELTVLNKRGR